MQGARPVTRSCKVYLCKARIKNVNPGDILLFYQSGNEIGSGHVRTVGIVDGYQEISRPENLLRATGRRSVYSADQQIAMLRDSSVKVRNFLVIGKDSHKDPIPLGLLNAMGGIKGVPQSIRMVSKTAYDQRHSH